MAAQPHQSEQIFKQVYVYFSPLGGTRVEWILADRFLEPRPHNFQLQTTNVSVETADDWEDVGVEAENTFYAADDSQRLYGKTLEAHYRVRLHTPVGVYYSRPAGGLTAQNYRDWRVSRKILQQELKRGTKYTNVYDGYLLKERRYGPPCPECLDPLTKEVTKSHCATCHGVGFLKGYFKAMPGIQCDLGLEGGAETQVIENAGTSKDAVVMSRISGSPQINSRDVFVEGRTGRRWWIERVARTAEVRGFTLVHDVEMRLLPYTDVVYAVPLEGS